MSSPLNREKEFDFVCTQVFFCLFLSNNQGGPTIFVVMENCQKWRLPERSFLVQRFKELEDLSFPN